MEAPPYLQLEHPGQVARFYFNPLHAGAGNALLWTVAGTSLGAKPAPTITDSQGLVWQLLANLYITGGPTGASNACIVQYLAQNVASVSMTTSLDLSAAVSGGGTWTLVEISNVNLGSGAYTFQTSDNLSWLNSPVARTSRQHCRPSGFSTGWQLSLQTAVLEMSR